MLCESVRFDTLPDEQIFLMKTFLNQHKHKLILIALLIIAAFLRLLQISTHSFWYDEAFSSLIANLRLSQILANEAATVHPPGYYLMLHFWLNLGHSDATIRSLSALFSWGSVVLIYGLGRWLFNCSTGLIAAFGMALFPFQIYFAQETRMYSLAVFVAVALTWLFLYAVSSGGRWLIWFGYTLVAVVGLYVHYFVGFLLLALHLWWIFNWKKYCLVLWRLILSDSLIAVLFLPHVEQALGRTTDYLGGVAWQTSPHILSPLTTIYYLLFAHRTPVWLFPISLFLSLTLLILILWESRRRSAPNRRIELALWLSLLTPIAFVLVISWLIRPIYLERSFAISSPALILLLAHGIVAAPKGSPTPYLGLLLIVPISVIVITNLVTPDPAKPPVRKAAHVIESNFASGDVSLHLQDASAVPALWYTTSRPQLLVDVPGALFIGASTHRLFGGDVVTWPTDLIGANRLWLTVMPRFVGPEQKIVFEEIDGSYPRLKRWDWGSVQLYLYDLKASDQ